MSNFLSEIAPSGRTKYAFAILLPIMFGLLLVPEITETILEFIFDFEPFDPLDTFLIDLGFNIKDIVDDINNYDEDYAFAIGATLYFPVVFGIRNVVKRLKPETKKRLDRELLPLNNVWNLLLSLFSGCGMIAAIYQLYYYGYNCSFLDHTKVWMKLFCLSKIPELLDTVFIVLRSKPLVMLQYYHHFATLLLCWAGLKVYPIEMIAAAGMNYSVHTFMYLYFALCGMGYRGLKKIGFIITIFQVLQMVIAVYVVNQTGINPCIESKIDLDKMHWFAVIMYSSYVILFGEILVSKIWSFLK